MKNLLRRLSPILALVMAIAMFFALVGCGENDANFEFTDEVIAKIDDTNLSNRILKYCNDFYINFNEECKIGTYIDSESISTSVATQLQDAINEKMRPTVLLGGDAMREIVSFYNPFVQLSGIRAKEYLNIKNSKGLSQAYIDGIKEQFEILKESYFKK